MGKLPTIAWTGMILASLGLAGCKCCHTCSNGGCSSGSCSSGSCSAPSKETNTLYHTSKPAQSLPQGLPPVSGQPVSMTPGKPAAVTTYKSVPMPSNYPNGWKPQPPQSAAGQSVSMPAQTQQIHAVPPPEPVMPVSGVEGSMPQTRTTVPASIPTITETMLPKDGPPLPRPPISH